MSAEGLQAGGAISVCVYTLEHDCVSACVFVRVSGGSASMHRNAKAVHLQWYRFVGSQERH